MHPSIPPGYVPERPVYTNQPGVFNPPFNPQYGPGFIGAAPITSQPGVSTISVGTSAVPLPPPIEGVPLGLEYLSMVDNLLIFQMVDLLEVFTRWECQNKYAIRNANGEQVYFAAEESDPYQRQVCGTMRAWTMHIVDNFQRQVMAVTRPFKYCSGWCCCASAERCSQECSIEAPPGNVIGSIEQTGTFCSTRLIVRDAGRAEVFVIQGPCCCALAGCQDKEFAVLASGGQQIGAVTKKWSGYVKEAYTNADIFGVTFPIDLDVRMKAILLGATFLLDFMHFEHRKQPDRRPVGHRPVTFA